MANEDSSPTLSSSEAQSPVLQAARRLRRVQISFSDEPENQRRTYIAEELETLLKAVPIDQRGVFLDELESMFPVFGTQVPATKPEGKGQEVPAEDTLEELVSKLTQRVAKMGMAEREALVERLAEAGLIRVDHTPASTDSGKALTSGGPEDPKVRESLQYIARSLKVERIDVARTAKMTVMLAVYMGQLDQVVWSAWQAVAPRSGLKRKNSLEKALQSYIGGDPSVSGADLNAQIATTKKLLTAFIAAIGQLGVQFARQHLAPFSPQEVLLSVNSKGANPLIGKDVACWALYQRMARGLEEEAVDDAVREIVAKNVTDMMKSQQ